jgi:hypothetical protein
MTIGKDGILEILEGKMQFLRSKFKDAFLACKISVLPKPQHDLNSWE